MSETSILSQGAWFETRFVGNPEDRFSRVAASNLDSSRTNITSATHNILKIMRKLFIRYVNGSHIIWLCSTSSYTQVIRNNIPQRGNGGDFDFLVAGPLLMTGGHNLFSLYALVICDHAPPPPPAQGNVEDVDFVCAVPYSNHHTVGTASWQNHDSSPPQSVIILHCNGCLSNTDISSTLWRQCKSQITAHLPGYHSPAQGLG